MPYSNMYEEYSQQKVSDVTRLVLFYNRYHFENAVESVRRNASSGHLKVIETDTEIFARVLDSTADFPPFDLLHPKLACSNRAAAAVGPDISACESLAQSLVHRYDLIIALGTAGVVPPREEYQRKATTFIGKVLPLAAVAQPIKKWDYHSGRPHSSVQVYDLAAAWPVWFRPVSDLPAAGALFNDRWTSPPLSVQTQVRQQLRSSASILSPGAPLLQTANSVSLARSKGKARILQLFCVTDVDDSSSISAWTEYTQEASPCGKSLWKAAKTALIEDKKFGVHSKEVDNFPQNKVYDFQFNIQKFF